MSCGLLCEFVGELLLKWAQKELCFTVGVVNVCKLAGG